MASNHLDPQLWAKLREDPLTHGTVQRRVLPDLSHDVFIGEDRPSRNRVLELSVAGEATNMPKRWRQSKGLEIAVDTTDSSRTKVRLRSLTGLGDSLFEELASDLVDTLAAFPGPDASTRVVERVLAWQEFFARRAEPFTEERAAGLFGELTVLSALNAAVGSAAAVHGWTGPDPALQDFQLGDVAIEVKTYRGNGPGRMKISSERQLEHVGLATLYLAYISLDQRQDGTGRTLLEKIDDVRALLRDSPAASHLFEGKLVSCGWRDSYSDERAERYEARSIEYFLVDVAFPRLVSDSLPAGVGDVRYTIDRSAVEDFLVDGDVLMDQMRTTN